MKMRMVAGLLAAAGALLLAACEDKQQAALVNSCVADGMPKDTCGCLAKETKKAVDADAYNAMVLVAQGKSEQANALMEKMPIEKRFTVATGTVTAMDKCAVNPKPK